MPRKKTPGAPFRGATGDMQGPAAPSEPQEAAGGSTGAQGAGEGDPGPGYPTRPAPRPSPGSGHAHLRTSWSRPARTSGGGSPFRWLRDLRRAGPWTKDVVCRYYAHGMCKHGENCRYSHDLSGLPAAGEGGGSPRRASAELGRGSNGGDGAAAAAAAEAAAAPAPSEPEPPEVAWEPPAACSRSWPAIGPEAGRAFFEEQPSLLAAGGAGALGWSEPLHFVPGHFCWGDGAFEAAEAPPPLQPPQPPCWGPVRRQPVRGGAGPGLPPLCRDAALGACFRGDACPYLHGDVCDFCGRETLHPEDAAQRARHIRACIEVHERDMEHSFAVQRNLDQVCGICMEVVCEKAEPSERRFGILSNCNHPYCLKCIRHWRKIPHFRSRLIKCCPQCRVSSDLVIPSERWVEDEVEKRQLIQEYKESMSTKTCRYFALCTDCCPFGQNCFYRHGDPEGEGEGEEPEGQAPRASRSARRRLLESDQD
ncbi:probable E3 ubiquitin-protein ligase makorin-3 [Saccopteryx bilineata]|uniref:probable E3 ubiquitin-protein ligase makorin-3 n=1 Tax=Saccopteryx bilineata TaxID=59482 RepID=UPI00338EBD57